MYNFSVYVLNMSRNLYSPLAHKYWCKYPLFNHYSQYTCLHTYLHAYIHIYIYTYLLTLHRQEDFMTIPELAMNPLAERIIRLFLTAERGGSSDGSINFRQFVKTLAHFVPAGTVRPHDGRSSEAVAAQLRKEKLQGVCVCVCVCMYVVYMCVLEIESDIWEKRRVGRKAFGKII